jgi:hypothetical protein
MLILNQYIECIAVVWTLIRQTLRHLGAIERLHPLKMARDIARFVRLNGTDEMPLQRQIAQRFDLRQRVIQIIFAELGDAARCCSPDHVDRLRLRCSYQADRVARPTASLGGVRDSSLNVGYMVADRVHGGCVNGVAV